MIRDSGTRTKNPNLEDWTDTRVGGSGDRTYRDVDNLRFFADVLGKLEAEGIGHQGKMAIGLLGQRDLPGVTLRRAQSILRWDLRPSLWSHAFLFADALTPDPEVLKAAPIREVSIHSRTGVFPDPAVNAVGESALRYYVRADVDANAGLVVVEMDEAEVEAVAHRALVDPNQDRMRYDLWRMLGIWESYMWSAGALPNPLRQGHPVFSSAFVEYCYEAIRLDLAPGASERNSAPEHIWNAAKWWYENFESLGRTIRCYCVLRDQGAAVLDREPNVPMFAD